MLKVGAFLKYLSDSKPESNPARLALYNWLRNTASPEEVLSKNLIERFFADALACPHWIDNSATLGRDVRVVVAQFNTYFTEKLSTRDWRFPDLQQIVELQHHHDGEEVLNSYLARTLKSDRQFRVLPDADYRFIAVILNADRSIEVRNYDRKFVLRAGQLEPLRRDLAIHYTSEMELSETYEHRIEIEPHLTARFFVENGGIQGIALRGYTFQKVQEMKGEILKDLPRLHMALKRLEQFFIDRGTDKDYQSLTQKLERTRALLQAGDAEAKRWAPNILIQAETALEQIYTGDQTLTLLIKYLRQVVSPEGLEKCPTLVPIDVSVSTNSLPTAGLRAVGPQII